MKKYWSYKKTNIDNNWHATKKVECHNDNCHLMTLLSERDTECKQNDCLFE